MTEKETGKRRYRRGGARGKDCRAGKIDILARNHTVNDLRGE
jgi:hypothetical protein